MSRIEVAPPAPSELGQLFGLAQSAFAEQPGWDERRVLEALERDVVFVAREDRTLAGYVALRWGEPPAVTVEHVLVAAGHEGRGVGRRLLAYAEGYAIAHRAHALRIVVERENVRARRFYLSTGFVPVADELFELTLPLADG